MLTKTILKPKRGSYMRLTEHQRSLLISLVQRYKVKAKHAAAHIGIRPSTATLIVRQYREDMGESLREQKHMTVQLKNLPGKCSYGKCKICEVKEDELSSEDSLPSDLSSQSLRNENNISQNRSSYYVQVIKPGHSG